MKVICVPKPLIIGKKRTYQCLTLLSSKLHLFQSSVASTHCQRLQTETTYSGWSEGLPSKRCRRSGGNFWIGKGRMSRDCFHSEVTLPFPLPENFWGCWPRGFLSPTRRGGIRTKAKHREYWCANKAQKSHKRNARCSLMPTWGTRLWGILRVLYCCLLRGRREERKEGRKDGAVSINAIPDEHKSPELWYLKE